MVCISINQLQKTLEKLNVNSYPAVAAEIQIQMQDWILCVSSLCWNTVVKSNDILLCLLASS